MRCPERIHDPVTAVLSMGDQRPDANDRVVDVLGELVSQFGSNLVIGLADVAVSGGEALQVGDGLNISNDHVAHVAYSTCRPFYSLRCGVG